MRRSLLTAAAAGIVLAACGDGEAGEEAAVQTQAAVQAAARDGQEGFVLMRGADTLAVERYSRTGGSLRGELVDAEGGERLTYTAAIGPEQRITRMELAYFEAGADRPRQTATAEFSGDTLVARTRRDGGEEEVERVPVPAGTMLHVGNSIATLEQLVRRARAVGGAAADLPVLLIGRDENRHELVEHVRVRLVGADSVEIVLDARNQARAAVDGEGRILGAVGSPGEVRAVRMP